MRLRILKTITIVVVVTAGWQLGMNRHFIGWIHVGYISDASTPTGGTQSYEVRSESSRADSIAIKRTNFSPNRTYHHLSTCISSQHSASTIFPASPCILGSFFWELSQLFHYVRLIGGNVIKTPPFSLYFSLGNMEVAGCQIR